MPGSAECFNTVSKARSASNKASLQCFCLKLTIASMPGINVIKRLCSWSLMLQKDMLGRHSENTLQTSYDHYMGGG